MKGLAVQAWEADESIIANGEGNSVSAETFVLDMYKEEGIFVFIGVLVDSEHLPDSALSCNIEKSFFARPGPVAKLCQMDDVCSFES